MSASLPSGNPKLPDSINNQHESPLRDFVLLAVALVVLVLLLAAGLSFSARWVAPLIPYEWEQALVPSQASQSAPGETDDTLTGNPLTAEQQAQKQAEKQAQDALNALMQKLLANEAAPLAVSVHWLADEALPNAFAMPGGQIFVTRGLVNNVSSENGLAMVLAHEYAHVALRHPLTLILEQLSTGLVTGLFGGDAAALISQQTRLATLLAFSRDMEADADAYAVQLVKATYGHAGGSGEFFAHMLTQHDEPGWTQMFSSHPLTQTRLDALLAQPDGALTPLPQALLQAQSQNAAVAD
ncbi:M48 family metallopeptidase [Thalassolituus sp. LLYu03]|uniref:M48 family metallopeptidase n=1 Tax=Thalassolituus sp. LLYu03 TaxID=3421656 RepID=UPI003D27B3B8